MTNLNDKINLAEKIIRGNYLNFNNQQTFLETSSIYPFTNEDITSYFHHLKQKTNVLTVIGSGDQILNSILAGTKNFTAFDISIFPEFYLYLKLASVIALDKEEYFTYYLSNDREELFHEDIYQKIEPYLPTDAQKFWQHLYLFNDGYDIYTSLLFRQEFNFKNKTITNNPYLQENNYEKLKSILQNNPLHIKTKTCNIINTFFKEPYDLINLSNICSYYFNHNNITELLLFLKTHFTLTDHGEIINYFYSIDPATQKILESLISPHGKVEEINKKKLLIYKKI